MPGPKTIDLRGSAAAPAAQGTTVLIDPTGRRARRMRLGGRIVGATFALWLCALVLAGLGVLPSNSVPLAGEIRPGTAPPALQRDDALLTRTSDAPALRPASATPPPARGGVLGPAPTQAPTPRRRARPVVTPAPHTPTPTTTPRVRNPNAANPQAPAVTPTAGPGNSGTAPGRVKTPRPKTTPAPSAATPTPTPTPRGHGKGKSG